MIPFLILAGAEGYVSELFIKAEWPGQGLGRQMLQLIKTEAKARGCARLSLLNMRDRESYEREFYKKQGWVERSEVANFILLLV